MRSVTVGTSTSACFTASASSAWLIGVSSRLSRTSNSSIIRVSIGSGSLRVTTTSGFFFGPGGIPPRKAIPLVACPEGAAARDGERHAFSSACRLLLRKYCITAPMRFVRPLPSGRPVLRWRRHAWCGSARRLCRGPALSPAKGSGRRCPASRRCDPTRSTSVPDRARAIPSTGCSGARACRSRSWPSTKMAENQGLAGGRRLGPSEPADRQAQLHHPGQARQPAQDSGHRGRGGARLEPGSRPNPLVLGRMVPGAGIQRRQRLAGNGPSCGVSTSPSPSTSGAAKRPTGGAPRRTFATGSPWPTQSALLTFASTTCRRWRCRCLPPLLHAATALALSGSRRCSRHDLEDDAIEVTMEEPKPTTDHRRSGSRAGPSPRPVPPMPTPRASQHATAAAAHPPPPAAPLPRRDRPTLTKPIAGIATASRPHPATARRRPAKPKPARPTKPAAQPGNQRRSRPSAKPQPTTGSRSSRRSSEPKPKPPKLEASRRAARAGRSRAGPRRNRKPPPPHHLNRHPAPPAPEPALEKMDPPGGSTPPRRWSMRDFVKVLPLHYRRCAPYRPLLRSPSPRAAASGAIAVTASALASLARDAASAAIRQGGDDLDIRQSSAAGLLRRGPRMPISGRCSGNSPSICPTCGRTMKAVPSSSASSSRATGVWWTPASCNQAA